MTAQDISIILGSAVTALSIVGGGIKYLLAMVDDKNRQAAAEQLQARQELTLRLHEEIRDLRAMVVRLQSDNALYLRRIFALEAYIHSLPENKTPLPDTPGWPPENLT